jgi:MraZ protein
MRFLGNIEAKTDQKGRVFLPSVFRKELQASGNERIVMRKDINSQCLTLYPESAWNERMDALFERADEWDAEEREVTRMFMQDVEVLTLDGNGRFLIPRRYMELADIKQCVFFMGMKDTIEIWAAEHVNKRLLNQEDFAAKLKAIMNRKKE